MTDRPKLRTAKRKKDLSMCLECLKKAASSDDRLPLTPHKPPAAPTGIPAIQALSVPERRGIVAQVRRLIWKSFPNDWALGAFQGRALQAAFKAPPCRLRSPLGPKLFWVFSPRWPDPAARRLSNLL